MMNDDETRNTKAPRGRNYKMADTFLTTLDWEGQYTFQTFDDDKARRKARGKKPDPLARVFNGALDEHWDSLVKLNDKGAGIYVTVNKTDGVGRKENNILRVNAVFIDNDRGGVDPGFLYDWLCPPTMVVTTSPGKWHAYWVTEGMPLETFTPFQEWLAKEFDTDPDVKDLSRVMRLPGFMHRKGEPALVTLDHTDGAYQFSDLRLHSGFRPPRLRIVKKGDEPTKFEASAEQVKGLLDHIIAEDPEYLNGRYHVWLELGMALHAWDEDEGYELWREVSEHSVHYNRAECEDKWETFDASRKGLKTLATYCHDFDYKISSHERASAEDDFAGIEKRVVGDWVSGFEVTQSMIDEIKTLVPVFTNFIYSQHIITIIGPPGSGKTSILLEMCPTMCANGFEVVYIHGDAVPDGLHIGKGIADKTEGRMKYLAPNMVQSKTMTDVRKLMLADIKSGVDLSKRVYVIDTLKQMCDVMRKEDAKAFYALCRKLTTLGATVILLAHTNKYNDAEGFPIYEGTGDVVSDSDDVFYLIPSFNKENDDEGTEYHYSSLYWQHKVRCPTEKMTWKIYRGGVAYPCSTYRDTLAMNKTKDPLAEKETHNEEIAAIARAIADNGNEPVSSGALVERCMEKYKLSRRKTLDAMKEGNGQFWECKSAGGFTTGKIYKLLPFVKLKDGKPVVVEDLDDEN